MANQACDNFVYCPPCADGNPFSNKSAEAADPADFFRFVFVQELPNFNALNDWWAGTAIPAGCHAPTVREAEDCARRLGETEIVGGWRDRLGIPSPLYSNAAQTCQVDCAVGLPFTYTVPAGTVVARTQAEADALAASYCLFRALQERACGPLAITLDATNITAASATLNGTVNANSEITSYYFDWGSTTAYGNKTTPQTLAAGTDSVAVSANLTSFGSTVHFRLVAVNQNGRSEGVDKTFQSPMLPPLAWWKLEEGGLANRVDIISSLSMAASNGGTGVTSSAAGKIAIAMKMECPANFDSAGALRGFSPGIPFNLDFEVTGWFKVDSITGAPQIRHFQYVTGGFTFVLASGAGGAVVLSFLGATIGGGSPALGVWHHFRAYAHRSTLEVGLQIDNGILQTTPFPFDPGVQVNSIFTVSCNAGVGTCTANSDEIGIWDRILTAAEVSALYNSGNGTTWPLT